MEQSPSSPSDLSRLRAGCLRPGLHPATPLLSSVNTCFACLGALCSVHKHLQTSHPLLGLTLCHAVPFLSLLAMFGLESSALASSQPLSHLTPSHSSWVLLSVFPAGVQGLHLQGVLFCSRCVSSTGKRVQNSADSGECSQTSGQKGPPKPTCFR